MLKIELHANEQRIRNQTAVISPSKGTSIRLSERLWMATKNTNSDAVSVVIIDLNRILDTAIVRLSILAFSRLMRSICFGSPRLIASWAFCLHSFIRRLNTRTWCGFTKRSSEKTRIPLMIIAAANAIIAACKTNNLCLIFIQ